VRLGVAVE